MNQPNIQDYLNKNVSSLNGVGVKIKKILKKKKIEKVSDLLWNFPHGSTDRSNVKNLNSLELGKIATIKVKVHKYNFPRIRNLPSKVMCFDHSGKIEISFFNSREAYIRKVLPLNSEVVISGKVSFYKNNYQMTNPPYIVPIEREKYVNTVIPKYSLGEGLTEKIYRKLIEQVLGKINKLKEWHPPHIMNQIGNVSWSESITKLHKDEKINLNSNFYRRLAYDEILCNLLVLSQIRKRIKKIKKNNKIFFDIVTSKVVTNLNFSLTEDQKNAISEINNDLKSDFKMFRILQGDVGSGKTIVSFISIANVIDSNFQAAMMAPTEILAKQHYKLAKKIFRYNNFNIGLLTGKMLSKEKKYTLDNLKKGKINFIIGTHSLFQKNIVFKKLGLIVIDEQHKFGVEQRIKLSNKGGKNCDILLMSATPIPRTLIMASYGDMDVSKILHKPSFRRDIITISKPEEKVEEVIKFIKKEIKNNNQVFWVCPLIEESTKLDYSAAVKKFKFLSEKFKSKVGLIHGGLNKDEKDLILNQFLKKKIDILVSTTVIEVGIDFPKANIIVIENSDKFGLSQLHQLRGRVGRGVNQGYCILLYKKNLSENAKKRIKILKSTNNGFEIAEEDMKLRGFGDILGYQQSGIKNFKIADPIHHQDLFKIAEKNIKEIENKDKNFNNYDVLMKLFDKADVVNQINLKN